MEFSTTEIQTEAWINKTTELTYDTQGVPGKINEIGYAVYLLVL